jgi:hypothetical protein
VLLEDDAVESFVAGVSLGAGGFFVVLVDVFASGGALDVGGADVVLVREVVVARGAADELER